MSSSVGVGPVAAATAALTAAADQLRAALASASDEALLDGTAAALTIADQLTCTGIRGTDQALADGTCERVEALPTETLLSLAASVTAGDARMLCNAAETLRALPATAALFAAGQLSWSQVRTVVCAARRLTGEQRQVLDATVAAVRAGGGSDPDEVCDAADACVERLRGDAAERKADRVAERERVQLLGMLDGAGRLYAELDPVGYAELIGALDGAADRPHADVSRAGQRAEALLRMCREFNDRLHADDERTDETADRGDAGETAVEQAEADEAADRTDDGADVDPTGKHADATTGSTAETATGDGSGTDAADAGAAPGGGPTGDLDGCATDRHLADDDDADGQRPTRSDRRRGARKERAWTPGGSRPRVHATIDVEALCSGRSGPAGTLWLGLAGGRVTLTRTDASLLFCGCGSVPIVLGADGTPVAIGDAEDEIGVRLRRAVVERDGGCRFPGCTSPPQWTDAHHVVWREHGGATCQENLALMCRKDHRKVHQRGWKVTLEPDGTMRFRRGRRVWTTKPRPSPSRDPRPPSARARPDPAASASDLPPLDPVTGEPLPF